MLCVCQTLIKASLTYLLTYLFPITGSRDWKFLNPGSRDWENSPGITNSSHTVAHLLYAASLNIHGREGLQRYRPKVSKDFLPAQLNDRWPIDGTGTDVGNIYIHPEVEIDIANVIRQCRPRLKQCGKQLLTIPPQILRHRQQHRQWSAANWTISETLSLH